ncbi:MAG: DUF4297 domain-containing protein [Candidatus Pacebacteria bacterium]|nr:DUF4297 domain-containing protein [Candidatus Paceibacterota bacterium]
MSGGPSAKTGFRYQDLCSVYFALENLGNNAEFEQVFCEQDKMDFEIWSKSSFAGYQVKSSLVGLTAKETNNILLYYFSKATQSSKKDSSFKFIFTKNPSKSLAYLFLNIRGDDRGIKYSTATKRFIEASLKGIDKNRIEIDYLAYDHRQIDGLVLLAATEILKKALGPGSDIHTEAVRSFIARLRDEIDKISCKGNSLERIYSVGNIKDLINDFLVSFRGSNLLKEGLHSTEVRLPLDVINKIIDDRMRANPIKIKKDKNKEGEAIKS